MIWHDKLFPCAEEVRGYASAGRIVDELEFPKRISGVHCHIITLSVNAIKLIGLGSHSETPYEYTYGALEERFRHLLAEDCTKKI